MKNSNIKSFALLILCYLIWGFQPLYFQFFDGMDTFILLFERILFAAILSMGLIVLTGRWNKYLAIFKDKKVFFREMIATVMLFGDWTVYLWAVQHGKIIECSLGYYIQPIVLFIFGAIIFHEKINIKYIFILVLIIVGIILSVKGFNSFPAISIVLSLLFAIYSVFKKGLNLDSVVSAAFEITMMVPMILIVGCIYFKGPIPVKSYISLRYLILFIGAGIVTASPTYLFSYAIKDVPLITNAFCQYISPSINFLCGVITGETVSAQKIISFSFIWVATILYTLLRISEIKKTDLK